MRWNPWVGLVAACVVTSGCASSGTSSAAAGQGGTQLAQPPDADDGWIEGTVVSDENAPISGADVAITKPIQSMATTDTAGAFALAALPPGEYSLFVSALGYEAAAQRVTVAAGEVTEARIVLRPTLVATEPTTTLFIDDFYWACAVSSLGVGAACYSYTQSMANEKHVVTHPSDRGLAGAVASIHWVANQYLGAKRTGVSAWDTGQKLFNTTVGFSPVTTRLVFEEEKAKKDTVTTWNYFGSYCAPTTPTNCASDPPHSVVQVVVEQRFKAYTTLFYGLAPPPDFISAPTE